MEGLIFTSNIIIEACQKASTKSTNPEDLIQKSSSSEYLKDFEKSKHAWPLILEILDTDNLDATVYKELASCLKQKLIYDIHQLPEAEYWNTAQSILSKAYFLRYY